MMSAKKKWRKLSGTNRLPEVIQGVEFKDGIKQFQKSRLILPSPTFGHKSNIFEERRMHERATRQCRIIN
jgi:hypothetical protein